MWFVLYQLSAYVVKVYSWKESSYACVCACEIGVHEVLVWVGKLMEVDMMDLQKMVEMVKMVQMVKKVKWWKW